jgi:hypothetical protein
MAHARRVSLFEREVRERLSSSAVELLLGAARVQSEGKRAASPSAGRAFFGTIMLTVILDAVQAGIREACDGPTAERLASLMADDRRVLDRVRALAEAEASRLAGAPIQVRRSDVRVRAAVADGRACLHIDVDVGD